MALTRNLFTPTRSIVIGKKEHGVKSVNLQDQNLINIIREIPVEILDKEKPILPRAISSRNYRVVDILIEKRIKIINQNPDTNKFIYHQALNSGYFPLIKYCIESGTNINRRDVDNDMEQSPLYIAISNCDINTIRYLLVNGIEVQSYYQEYGFSRISPLIRAIQLNKSIELIDLLISYGADINEQCYEYFWKGINIKNTEYNKLTTNALGFSVFYENISAVELLKSQYSLIETDMIFENNNTNTVFTSAEYQN